MKKIVLGLVLSLFCSNNIYANDTYITIGTGGSTGVYFQVGNAMCKMVAKIQSQKHGRKKGTEKSYRCYAPSTGGSNFNIGKISEGDLQFGLAQSDWHGHAYNGTSSWRGKQIGDLRAVFSVHNEPFQIMVKKRKIKSFDDLRGKVVNIGNPGSGQRGFMEELLNAQGISTSFFKRATELTSSEMFNAFCKNKIDAFGYAVGFPNGAMEYAARCGGTLINLNSTAIQRLVEKNPAYAFATIPRGTYSGQKRDIQTYGVKATVVTSVDVSEETVYDVVKAVFDNLDDFKKQHPAFAYLNKNMMLDGLSAPLHNGALKYFNESGASITQKPDTKTPRTEPNNKKKITEKPKKKKPKSLDGSKVVAASSGTGFFVSRNGHIITNDHVIEQCNNVKVSYGGKAINANVLASDKTNDLAILKSNIKPKEIYSVSNEDVTLLQEVIVAGYPLGKRVSAAIKATSGSVTALAGFKDNYSNFQTDAALNQGNSGGPIINKKGNVVGVAVANYGKKKGIESFNFGIKSSVLKTFANSNGLQFQGANFREMSKKDLGQLITDGTVYLECWMTVAKIKQIIASQKTKKAFFSEYQK